MTIAHSGFENSRAHLAQSELPEQQLRQSPRYRATLPLMVLAFRDNHHAAVTIPAGDIFEFIGPAQDDPFVIVSVKDEQFPVFCDIGMRAKPIHSDLA